MGEIQRFQDLVCWQLAMRFSDLVDSITCSGGASRDLEFRRQIRRAAMKAPAQIAEAFMRWNAADTANVLRIARGSLAEVQSHLVRGQRRAYWNAPTFRKVWTLSEHTIAMTTAYMLERQRTARRQKQVARTDV